MFKNWYKASRIGAYVLRWIAVAVLKISSKKLRSHAKNLIDGFVDG
jgi:hypothetical protein